MLFQKMASCAEGSFSDTGRFVRDLAIVQKGIIMGDI